MVWTRFLFGAVVACNSPSLGDRIQYEVMERPSPFLGGYAGKCSPGDEMIFPDSPSARLPDPRQLKWAVGASLWIRTSWPDRTDCNGDLFKPVCPTVTVQISPINSNAWSSKLTWAGAAATMTVTAAAAGDGGFQTRANGRLFAPDFVLSAVKPTEIWFERAAGHGYGDVIPGRIDSIDLAAGLDGAVVVTLRNAFGYQLCGPVRADVTVTGDAFTIDKFSDDFYANYPYHLLAGTRPGSGAMQITAGDLQATLRVRVNVGQ